MPPQYTYNQWDSHYNSDQISSMDRHRPNSSMTELEDRQDIMHSKLGNPLNPLTPDQESPHDKFKAR